MENLHIQTASGKAKVIGTLAGVGGAMLLTFYKGAELNILPVHVDLLKTSFGGGNHSGGNISVAKEPGNRVKGSLLAIASCFCYSIWLIIQKELSEVYPCQYSSTALFCLIASLQSVAYALFVDHNWEKWRMGFDVRLLTVAYAAIVTTGLIFSLMSWCIRRKGPLYASVFNPLMLVIVVFLSSLLLNDEKIYLGTVLGVALIVCGLYAVLWGKRRESAAKVADYHQLPTSAAADGAMVSSSVAAAEEEVVQVLVAGDDKSTTRGEESCNSGSESVLIN